MARLVGMILADALTKLAEEVRDTTGRAEEARRSRRGNEKDAEAEAPAEFNREKPSPAQEMESRTVLRIETINRRCLPTRPKARGHLAPCSLGVGRHLGLA
jgi:hypothetical protein